MRFKSTQIKGHGRGKLLGYPTINLVIPDTLKLEDGIYAAFVYISQKKYLGALHFGPIPTFQEDKKSLEVFLIDVDEPDFIIPENQKIELEIKNRLRDIQNFKTEEDLTIQIAKDVKETKALLS